MKQFTFHVDGEDKIVEADDLEEALAKAGIEEGDIFELVEEDNIEDKCLLSAITDDILFGS